MNLFKDMKFQLALIAIIAAIVNYFVPDVDGEALVSIVTTLVGIILGGHGVVESREK